jgi:nucleotide-binding universal stress UspA family protein
VVATNTGTRPDGTEEPRSGEVVVGVDGSPGGAAALRWAVQEARRRGRVVRAVLVWNALGEPDAVYDHAEHAEHAGLAASAAAVLHAAVRAVAVPYGVRMLEQVIEGVPAESLAHTAQDAALLVVGTRGHGLVRRHIPGSVGRACARQAGVPTVVVLGARTIVEPVPPVVVGIDGSATADAALSWAASEAALRGAPLLIVHAWPLGASGLMPMAGGSLAQAGEALLRTAEADVAARMPGLTIRTRLVPEPAPHALLEAARDAQLLVVGAHGRGGFPGMIFGSISGTCLAASPCTVAVIPPAGPAEMPAGVDTGRAAPTG